jgi:hypothetical protein
MSLFISFYSRLIADRSEAHSLKQREMEEEVRTQVSNTTGPIAEVVLRMAQGFHSHRSLTQKENRLLNPRRQLARMFIPLMGSLLLVALSYLAPSVDGKWPWYWYVLTIGSLLLYACGVLVLRQVLWILVGAVQRSSTPSQSSK